MKRSDNNDQHQIEESLKLMPKVEDNMEKDILYQRISSELNKRGHKRSKKVYVLPALGTVMVLALLVLIIPTLMNDVMFQSSSESSGDRIMEDSAANESMESSEEAGIQSNSQENSADSGETQQDTMMMDRALTSNVIHSPNENSNIVHGAVMDSQAQYVVPFSIPISSSENPEKYYNQLGSLVDEGSWGVSEFMFNDATFRLNRENSQVLIDLPKDFSIGPSGAPGNSFEDTLTAMFKPYQIDTVNFNREVKLGAIGSVNELPLKSKKVVYKLYKESADKREFLVRVPVEDQADMKTALSEMKKDEKDFNVSQSVPNSVDFSVKTEGKQVLLTFNNKESVTVSQETVTMIDALLMTAKSFGYQEVRFTNAPYETIGPYELTGPIKVPEGANPININE
ncbi:hypothetical protein [Virgibacillus doumboii]|uniref:hypothetical protein n=1 Tax=Virgibacillus doumboii TaxID=2697503 RepID=UPI0013E08C38|nr:hypothetical protein [Virgibacillus doumboii]